MGATHLLEFDLNKTKYGGWCGQTEVSVTCDKSSAILFAAGKRPNVPAAVGPHIFEFKDAYKIPTWMTSFRGRGGDFSGNQNVLQNFWQLKGLQNNWAIQALITTYVMPDTGVDGTYPTYSSTKIIITFPLWVANWGASTQRGKNYGEKALSVVKISLKQDLI